MTFAEDAAQLLGRSPREDASAAPEPARREALVVLKRAEATLARDPRAALATYVEALDLDPGCKAAYESVAKLVLARAEGDRPAIEGALRFVTAGLKRLPQDAQLRELEKKLKAALPVVAPEAAAIPRTPRAPESRPMAGHGPGRVCPMCQSPIPIGSPDCRSCSVSGELPRPAGVVDRSQKRGSPVVIVALVLVLLVAGGAGAWFVLARGKPAGADPKKP